MTLSRRALLGGAAAAAIAPPTTTIDGAVVGDAERVWDGCVIYNNDQGIVIRNDTRNTITVDFYQVFV